jgi:hypothetical protein
MKYIFIAEDSGSSPVDPFDVEGHESVQLPNVQVQYTQDYDFLLPPLPLEQLLVLNQPWEEDGSSVWQHVTQPIDEGIGKISQAMCNDCLWLFDDLSHPGDDPHRWLPHL